MPTGAGQDLIVAGLQASHCLCLSGVHVLTPTIMKLLADELQNTSTGQSIHLSSALNTLAGGTMPIRIRRSLLGGLDAGWDGRRHGGLFDPAVKPEAQLWLQPTMLDTKKSMELRLPFAMEPVVYEFEINDRGTWGTFASDQSQRMSNDYYAMMVPAWLQLSPHEILKSVRFEMEQLGSDYRNLGHFDAFKRIIEGIRAGGKATREKVETMLKC